MKTLSISTKLLFIFTAMTFTFTACQKEETGTEETEREASEDLHIATIEDGNTQLMADQAEASGDVSNLRLAASDGSSDADILGSCAVITKDTATSLRKITIDFGTGCTGPNGVTRKGKIIITHTGRYRAEGTIIHIVSEDYYVNDNKVDINKTVENLGKNEQNNFEFKVKSTRKVTFPNGKMSFSAVLKIKEWLVGAATPFDFSDDIFKVVGEGTHQSRRAVHYNFHTLTPLIRKVACREFVSGELKIVRVTDERRFAILNFGTGDCDDEATVTLDNGRAFTIDLKH